MEDFTEHPTLSSLHDCKALCFTKESFTQSQKANYLQKSTKQQSSLLLSPALKEYQSDLTIIKKFILPELESLKEKLILLGPKTKKFTLILDLDHTLVNTKFYKSSFESLTTEYVMNIRPYAINLIQEMSMYYEIIVFSAGSEEYTNEVVSILDPYRQYVKKVISCKNCVEVKEGFVIKDLRIFADREIKDILIVDDCIYSYAFQIENGVPVKPFDENSKKDDKELVFLMYYLKKLYDENPENLAEANKKKFWSNIEAI